MTQQTALRMIEVQEQAAQDPDYQTLTKEYRILSSAFLARLEILSPEDTAVIEDYLGLVGQMYRRLLELACSEEGSG